MGMGAGTEGASFKVVSAASCSGSLKEDRAARGPNRHNVFSLTHRSQLPPGPVFLIHFNFCEWQRLQAERVFPGRLTLDSPPDDSDEIPDAESEATGRVMKRSILRMLVIC
jgi:hypothetical protein